MCVPSDLRLGSNLDLHGMGYSNPRKREVLGDIESGCGFPGDINNNNHPITGNIQGERLFSRLTGGVLRYNVVPSGESINNLEAANLGKPSQVAQENVALLINKNPGRLNEERSEKEHAKEKLQFANVKRPSSKPPRPPKGPLLDASDVKLVREISELVMKKRARRERIKALKKARAAKLSSSPSSSNNSTIFGMAITVVFFLIIIFQGKEIKFKQKLHPHFGSFSFSFLTYQCINVCILLTSWIFLVYRIFLEKQFKF